MTGEVPSRAVPEMPGFLAPADVTDRLRAEVNNLLSRKSRQFPGSQPVSFARHHIQNLLEESYFVCEKSDGIRCLMYISDDAEVGGEAIYLITRNNDFYFVQNLHYPTQQGPQYWHKDTIIDGELVLSRRPGGEEQLQYLMFDCLVMDKKPLIERDLDKRLGYLREFIYKPYVSLCNEFPQDARNFTFKTLMKTMENADTVKEVIDSLPTLRHVSDGLIFTPRNTPYEFGTDKKLLKWKPPQENSVDFKLEMEFPTYTDPDLPPDQATYLAYDDKPTCHLLVWLGGNKDERYGELHLEDEEWEKLKALGEPLQGRIVEAYKDDEHRWRYMRFRDDKTNGNHTTVVDSVMESIDDAVSQEELVEVAPRIRTNRKQREAEAAGGVKRPSMSAGSSGHGDDAKLGEAPYKRAKR